MIDTAKNSSLQFRWEIVAQGEDGPGPRSGVEEEPIRRRQTVQALMRTLKVDFAVFSHRFRSREASQ